MKSFKYTENIALILLLYHFAFTQDAKSIVQKSNELLRANSSYSEMTMKVVKEDWSREYSMKVWAFEPDYALVLITAPASDKGTVTLKRENQVWNWIPTIRREIKIPPSMMMQSWMGSDFTNDDLVRQSSIVEDYNHVLVDSEEYAGYDCYKIQLNPKPEAGVVWGKILSRITKDGYMELKAEYYDEDGFLIRSMIGSKIKEMNGRTIPTHWEMIPQDEPGQKTVMEYQKIDFNIDINESFFSKQNMKRIR
ncbi:MAG TPA: outer membrane lipoprotein-sorting protein [Caldithrix sp.]|nr:outer membrane lipoprotein-sorting protein [Calditrichaceae bacterium]HEM48774.1 outer membrane lipoprotein-sorting protein [Caldithrix sp.]